MRRLVPLLVLIACRPGSGAGDDESGSSVDAEDEADDDADADADTGAGFDPLVCGTWEATDPLPASPPPPSACDDGATCPRFTDVTEAAGLWFPRQYIPVNGSDEECIFDLDSGAAPLPNADCEPSWFTAGVTVGDFDGDGWTDVFVTRLAASDLLFRNRGDGTFEDVSEAAGLGSCTFTNGALFTDADEDGDLDLFVTAMGEGAHLHYENQGDGTFVEIGEASGFGLATGGRHSGESISAGDYDLDGHVDLWVGEWIEPHNVPHDFSDPGPHGSRLLRGRGDGTFEDVTEAAGVSLLGVDPDGIYGFSATFVDIDDDDDPDLAVAADFRSSRLFRNDGDGTFTDITDAANVAKEGNAMGVTWGDFDGDGRLDWFVTSIYEEEIDCPPDDCGLEGSGNRLYRNLGDGTFEQAVDGAGLRDGGWGWGTVFFDRDNDGDLDTALVNGWPGRDLNGGFLHRFFPMRVWDNDGFGHMSEVGPEIGAVDEGQGRGIVTLDYDRDGDLDLLLANHAGHPVLYRNDGGNAADWLRIDVIGDAGTHPESRGAVVTVEATDGGRTQVQHVGVGAHFLGENERTVHVGLGAAADPVHRVTVHWPVTNTTVVLEDVAPRQTLTVRESDG